VNAKLVVGDIWAKMAHWVGGDAKFEIPVKEISGGGVRGTTFELSYDPSRKRFHAHAIVDSVYLFSGSSRRTVPPGHCGDIVADKIGTPYKC